MLIHPWDAARDPDEWRQFAVAQGFGQLVAAGSGRRRPIVVPTQFVLDGGTVRSEPASGANSTVRSEPASGAAGTVRSEPASGANSTVRSEPASEAMDVVLLHLARPNPIWRALEENPYAVLAVAGDWAYIPSSWKAIGEEDPALGIPTTYYGAVQLSGEVEIIDDPEGKLAILRKQLAALQPEGGHVDPVAHRRELNGIRGVRLRIDDIQAKFKYGGNADAAHRLAVADHLSRRDGPGDAAARAHLMSQLERETPCP